MSGTTDKAPDLAQADLGKLDRKAKWPDRRLTRLFGIEHPILLSPMAGLGSVELAAAVGRAGALGSLGCAGLSPDRVRQAVRQMRALVSAPINVNFFCHHPARPDPIREAAWRERLAVYYREFGIDPLVALPLGDMPPFNEALCDVVEETRPEVVSFHFGLPDPALLVRVKAAQCRIISSATTVAEAVWLEAHGVDVIIAQGFEAGGHRATFLPVDGTCKDASQTSTFALVTELAGVVGVPIVAAGGIADARGIATALQRGAAGVQLGTAYLLCPEASTPAFYREALQRADARATVVTNVFTGRPARAIINRLIREAGPMRDLMQDFPLPLAALAPLRRKAEPLGTVDFTPLWAGEAVSLAREVQAEALSRSLAEEALALVGIS